MSEWTEGPWFVDYDAECGVHVVDGADTSICKVAHRRPDGSGPHNAYLIAAAPDLCNALQESTDLLEMIARGKDWGAIEEFIQDNLAAIEKAKGENQ